MTDEQRQAIRDDAAGVLQRNDHGQWTIPAEHLYPHQWLWDSCFIAIGLRHLNVARAQVEILHLLSGQWSNGMLPHIIFNDDSHYRRDRELWRSYLSPYAPDHVFTSGITQPPMLAEAVVQIGKNLSAAERRTWYQTVFPALVRYHCWLYEDRDPHSEGLVLNIHPYETGLDSTPPWIDALREHNMPWWISLMERLRLERAVNAFRRDTRYIPPGQRMSSVEALAYFSALLRLRRKGYNTSKILNRSLFAIEDLAFNCITIRANKQLQSIAKTIRRELPEQLVTSIKKAETALDQLWDASTGQYYCRNFATHKLIIEPTISTLLPLYAGCISKERAAQLVDLLNDKKLFKTSYPVPSVPLNSTYFDPIKYWQGPTWINTNWLIIDGLRRYGYENEADELRDTSLQLVRKHGMFEYFNPKNGEPEGAPGFSWTAALSIDLLEQ